MVSSFRESYLFKRGEETRQLENILHPSQHFMPEFKMLNKQISQKNHIVEQ